jgi:hypothetical protein
VTNRFARPIDYEHKFGLKCCDQSIGLYKNVIFQLQLFSVPIDSPYQSLATNQLVQCKIEFFTENLVKNMVLIWPIAS